MENRTERINGNRIEFERCSDDELKMLAGYTMRRALDARHDLNKIQDEIARRREHDNLGGHHTAITPQFNLHLNLEGEGDGC